MAIVKPSLLAAILCSLTNGGSVEGGVTTGVRHLLSNAVDGVVGYSAVDKVRREEYDEKHMFVCMSSSFLTILSRTELSYNDRISYIKYLLQVRYFYSTHHHHP